MSTKKQRVVKASSGWTGPNKMRVRLFKVRDIEKRLRVTGRSSATLLSFPGTSATFERMLLLRGLLEPQELVAIQTYERLSDVNEGARIFSLFEKQMREHFRDSFIWPYNFLSFSKSYRHDGCSLPSNSKTARWRRQPYYKHLRKICAHDTKRFSVLDIDLCGIFNRVNSSAVLSLFDNGVVAPTGELFITHQKGRDIRGGKLFRLLEEQMLAHETLDYESLIDRNDYMAEMDYVRYVLIPLYYMTSMYDRGYILRLRRIIEYRDKVTDGHPAVTMIQYFFSWTHGTMYNYTQDAFHDEAIDHMQQVIDREIPFFEWID